MKYGYKIELKQSNGEYKELLKIKNLNLKSEINSFYSILKFSCDKKEIISNHIGQKCIKFSLMVDNQTRVKEFYLDELVSVDKYYTDLICKSDGVSLERQKKETLKDGFIKDDFSGGEFLGDFRLNSVTKKGSNLAELIKEKCKRSGITYYEKGKKIVFDDKFYIKNQEAKYHFFDFNVVNISINIIKNSSIKEIVFNDDDAKDIYNEPSLVMVVDPSPQPCSPNKTLAILPSFRALTGMAIDNNISYYDNTLVLDDLSDEALDGMLYQLSDKAKLYIKKNRGE